jgi:hypothetical protein
LVLLDKFAPFGLQTSPLQWGRLNGLVHRVQRRVLSALKRCAKGLMYVDDSTWKMPSSESLITVVILILVAMTFGIEIEFKKTHIGCDEVKVLGAFISKGGRETFS